MLPDLEILHKAIAAYIRLAYGDSPPPPAARLLPPRRGDSAEWLMSEAIERDPPDAPLDQVHCFIFRLGNRRYPHMKIRLTRPPGHERYVLSVDAHDVFLHAPPNSPDEAALEDLKRYNGRLSQEVLAEWDRLELPTERAYMRLLIEQARDRRE
jgi:hypothetical protein